MGRHGWSNEPLPAPAPLSAMVLPAEPTNSSANTLPVPISNIPDMSCTRSCSGTVLPPPIIPLTQEMMDAIAEDVSRSSNARVTTHSLFSDLRQGKAPKSLFKRLSVNVPEEIEMESVSFQDFQEAKFNY
jgi:hypothetical protein